MLTHDTVLHAPIRETMTLDGVTVLLDPAGPNWIGTDERGRRILDLFDGTRTFGHVVRTYAAEAKLDVVAAWQHVDTFARDAIRRGMLADQPIVRPPYRGRASHLGPRRLTELWLHTNNSCNLACSHCLVSSGPDGDKGLPTDVLLRVIADARALGVHRFFFTGGEPFLRKDILALIDATLEDPKAELAILTNGILFTPSRIEELRRRDPARLKIQISLDGSTPETNDPIRGKGSFQRIVDGIRAAVGAGLSATVSTVITEANADDVPEVTRLVSRLGGTTHHLLWLHKRGRADDGGVDRTPSVEHVIEVVRRTREVGRSVGVMVDNHEAVKTRLRYHAGTKRDLASAGISSLCVYADGSVYPSAAMADVPELRCGSILEQPLQDIWMSSTVARTFASATVEDKAICRTCPLKFLCGGGDIEHAYFYGGSIAAHDPYCELHKAMIADALQDLTEERKALVTNRKSGFSAPIVYTGMGESAVTCATDETPGEVLTSRSECVLTFDLDAPRKVVREFYGNAAETPQEELCCPVQPNPDDLAHIPKEVVERFYGCGSPVGAAGIRAGETTLDLGSGAGIDVFIAAKKVGTTGRAIGVDMTPKMLAVARDAQKQVASALGYDVVEFREGFLEQIPAESQSVDLVTSNCVINLSPDKPRVFAEMWRVLTDHGRIVIADIVADQEVPPHQRQDPRLWGECISGALTEEEFLAALERAGFYGLQVLKKTFWKEVEGFKFFSITVRGFKFEKTAGCVYAVQTATYLGPFKGVSDEEGHWFPRNVAVEVCTDTAAKVSHAPYAGLFVVTGVTGEIDRAAGGCDPTSGCC
ncbi:MAG: methyltransferase domain-containing protein [Nitrospirae bacterium]|nr:methyltransferase domain-containing protein [Nitrospirota bacterium]